jgi:hypothetical protein
VIHVRERVPIARLDGARDLVVDSEGLAFKSGDVVVEPVLYGWQGKQKGKSSGDAAQTKASITANLTEGAVVDARSRTVLAAFPRFPESIRTRARKLHVGGTFVLRLLGGTEIRFGGLTDLEVKAHAAEAVLLAERGQKLDYVDVRSPTVPVSREKAPPTPQPTSAPTTGPARTGVSQPQATPAPTATPVPATAQAPATPSGEKSASPLR